VDAIKANFVWSITIPFLKFMFVSTFKSSIKFFFVLLKTSVLIFLQSLSLFKFFYYFDFVKHLKCRKDNIFQKSCFCVKIAKLLIHQILRFSFRNMLTKIVYSYHIKFTFLWGNFYHPKDKICIFPFLII
jgi:hypothetical protein